MQCLQLFGLLTTEENIRASLIAIKGDYFMSGGED